MYREIKWRGEKRHKLNFQVDHATAQRVRRLAKARGQTQVQLFLHMLELAEAGHEFNRAAIKSALEHAERLPPLQPTSPIREPWRLPKIKVKCDGNHGGPACDDPECWQRPGPSD